MEQPGPSTSPYVSPEHNPSSPDSPVVQIDMELVQERIHEVFGSESNTIVLESDNNTDIIAFVVGPTHKKDDSDVEIRGPNDVDDDDNDDDNADNDDSSSPRLEH